MGRALCSQDNIVIKVGSPFICLGLFVSNFLGQGKARIDEAKWFPPMQVLDNIAADIEAGRFSLLLPGFSLAGNRREPTILREVHLYFDTDKFALEKLNVNFEYKILLGVDEDQALGQWICTRLDKPGDNLSSFWARVEVSSEPDRINIRGENPYRTLVNLAYADSVPSEASQVLKDEGLTFDKLQPAVVLGVTRRQWTFVDSARKGEEWVNLQLTRVTSSPAIRGRELLGLPKLDKVPESDLGASWSELEVEERGWNTTAEGLHLTPAHRDLGARLKIFLQTYGIYQYEEEILPKYHRALALDRKRSGHEL